MPVGGHAEDAQGRIFENAPVFLLGQTQFFRRLLELGHIVEDADQARDFALGAFVHGPVGDDRMERPLGIGDFGLAHSHPGFAKKTCIFLGQEPGKRRSGHVSAFPDGGRVILRAAPFPEGRIAAHVIADRVLEIERNGNGVDQRFQERKLILEFFLHGSAPQDVGDEQNHDVAQDKQTYDDGPEDGDIDMVEGVWLVDQGEVGRQFVRGDTKTQHLAIVEDVGVVGMIDKWQGRHG